MEELNDAAKEAKNKKSKVVLLVICFLLITCCSAYLIWYCFCRKKNSECEWENQHSDKDETSAKYNSQN